MILWFFDSLILWFIQFSKLTTFKILQSSSFPNPPTFKVWLFDFFQLSKSSTFEGLIVWFLSTFQIWFLFVWLIVWFDLSSPWLQTLNSIPSTGILCFWIFHTGWKCVFLIFQGIAFATFLWNIQYQNFISTLKIA